MLVYFCLMHNVVFRVEIILREMSWVSLMVDVKYSEKRRDLSVQPGLLSQAFNAIRRSILQKHTNRSGDWGTR